MALKVAPSKLHLPLRLSRSSAATSVKSLPSPMRGCHGSGARASGEEVALAGEGKGSLGRLHPLEVQRPAIPAPGLGHPPSADDARAERLGGLRHGAAPGAPCER